VQRPSRILRNALTLLSLLLCIASVVFWIRSRHVTHSVALTSLPIQWSLSTSSGTVSLVRSKSWYEPDDLKKGITPTHHERSLLGFGTKQSEQPDKWVNHSGTRTIGYTTVIRTYYAPLWFCVIVFSILPLLQYPRLLRRFYRRKHGLCPDCGYDLRASPDNCPECGKTVHKKEQQKHSLPTPR
jgi:hypothetical protein